MSTTIKEMRTVLPGYYNVRFGEPEYTDWMDESMSWKQTCYIGDWSFLWQRWFRGPDALKLFSDISVNSFAKFEIGQSKHAIHCNKAGKIVHEGILSRFGEQEFLLFGRGCFWADYRLRHGSYDATSEHTEPPAGALMSGEFLVMAGEGQAYSEQEADHWLGQTGWRKHERTPLAGMSSVIVAEAA